MLTAVQRPSGHRLWHPLVSLTHKRHRHCCLLQGAASAKRAPALTPGTCRGLCQPGRCCKLSLVPHTDETPVFLSSWVLGGFSASFWDTHRSSYRSVGAEIRRAAFSRQTCPELQAPAARAHPAPGAEHWHQKRGEAAQTWGHSRKLVGYHSRDIQNNSKRPE